MYSKKYCVSLSTLSLILLGLVSCESNFRKSIPPNSSAVEYLNKLKTCSPHKFSISLNPNLSMVIVTTFTIEGTIKNNNENLCLVKIHSYQSNTDKTNEAFLTECRYTDENIQVMTNEDGYKEAVEIDNTRKPSTTLSDNRRELLDEIYAKACIKTK